MPLPLTGRRLAKTPLAFLVATCVAAVLSSLALVAGCSGDDKSADSASNDGGASDATTVTSDGGVGGGDDGGGDALAPPPDGSPPPSGDGGDGGTTPVACTVPAVTITHDPNFSEPGAEYVFVDAGSSPPPVCNDGTPAVYVIRPGFGSAAARWNIQLEGGGVCYDQASCAMRTPGLLTSSKFDLNPDGSARPGDDALGGGILSANVQQNPDFYDATTVLIHYCSSDYWSGHHVAVGSFSVNDPSTWNFLGRSVLEGVFADLTAHHGLGSASEVLLSGSSAGALGAFLTANDIVSYLPASARLVVLPDAGYYVDRSGYDASAPDGVSAALPTPTEEIFGAGEQLWSGTGEKTCAATHDAGDFACFEPELLVKSGVYPMPLFIRQSEADNIQLTDNGDPPSELKTTTGLEYAYYYAGQQVAAQSQIPSPYSVFGTADTHHTQTGTSTFTSPAYSFPDAGSLTIAQAVGQWYRDPCTQHLWIQPVPDGGALP